MKTKLFIPYLRTKLVERTRLLEKLSLGHKNHHRLLLVNAPAGFGKTTLVRSWIEMIHSPTAWFTIESADSHPRQFLNYLVTAVCHALPELEESLLPVTTASPPLPIDYIQTLLVNKIADTRQPLIIVLDDYHNVDSPEIDTVLAFLLDHLPTTTTLVVVTRTEPKFSQARQRARGQMTEITIRDLRFTSAETENFFDINFGLHLDSEVLSYLKRITEGWVAGLQLLAMNLHADTALKDILHSLKQNRVYTLDYLTWEVLEGQPEEIQSILYCASALEKINPELAAAMLLIDKTSARQSLAIIQKQNLFLFPLDSQSLWYQIHPLFREVLQKKAEGFLPGQKRILHGRASMWFENNGMIKEAIQHALTAGDQRRAITLLESHAESLLLSGKYDAFLQFIAALDADYGRQAPILMVYRVVAMLFSEYSQQSILDALKQAEDQISRGKLTGEIGAIKAVIQGYTADPLEGIALSKKALEKISSKHTFFRNLVERNLGVAYLLRNDLVNAIPWFEQLLLSSYELGDWGGVLAAYNYLTFIRKVQGRLKEAGVIYQKALAFIEENNLELMPHAIKIIAGYGQLLLSWHQMERAKSFFKRAIQMGKKTDIYYAHSAYHGLSEVYILENDTRSALKNIQELRYLTQGKLGLYQDMHDQMTLAMEARIHLEERRIERANIWLISSGIDKLAPDQLLTRFGFELGLILPVAARIYLVKNQPERAAEILEGIIPYFIQQNANAYLTSAFCSLAIVHQYLGCHEKAVRALTKAIELAESEENFGDFMIVGGKLIPLLYETLSAGIAPEFTSQLLAYLAALNPSQKNPVNDLGNIDTLSHREMDVLKLISEGLTNQEIAQKLYLSTNTIKSHSIKIYRKLNVNNRSQAVSKARLLGILPTQQPPNFSQEFGHNMS
ncbi:AAA family ATPase (plasmid) [Chloroflexota bacterium]|nr:AAA family ATPase [Chloroflexota bacterium]